MKSQAPKTKSQTNSNDQNSEFQTVSKAFIPKSMRDGGQLSIQENGKTAQSVLVI